MKSIPTQIYYFMRQGPGRVNLLNLLRFGLILAVVVTIEYSYALLVSDLNEALDLHDRGYKVIWGAIDDPETYRRVQVEQARLVASTANDMVNTNVAFTVGEISEDVTVMTTANFTASVDILELAGSNHVVQLGQVMGQALARRVTGGDTLAHPIGSFDSLVIAEAAVGQTPLVGQTLREADLRQKYGVTVLGVWERGQYENAGPDTPITAGTVLMVAEGVDVFEVHVPKSLVGKSLAETAVRQKTGCNVVALRTKEGLQINPDPRTLLPADGELIIIRTTEAEAAFLEEFGAKGKGDR